MRRFLAFLAALSTVLFGGTANAQSCPPHGFGPPVFEWTGPGADFSQSSATTRVAGIVTPTQSDPFTLAPIAIPPTAQVIREFVCWNYLVDGPAPLSDTIHLNGQAVVGSLVRSCPISLGWNKSGIAVYAAELSGVLAPNTAIVVANAGDKPLGTDPLALGEGITAMLVTRLANGASMRRVTVWTGLLASAPQSNVGDAFWESFVFSPPGPFIGLEAHFFMNAMDGSSAQPDELRLQFSSLIPNFSAGGALSGAGTPSNNFLGLSGPLAVDNLYDAIDDRGSLVQQIAGLGIIASNSAAPGDDTFAHSMVAYSWNWFDTVPGVFCTAKTTSQGCVPSISTAGPFGVNAGPVVPNEDSVDGIVNFVNPGALGLIIFSPTGNVLPFHGGTLCVSQPFQRSPLRSAGGQLGTPCSGVLSYRLNAPGAPMNQLVGNFVYLQGWFRDGLAPFGDGLSDAIEVVVQ